MLQQGQVSFKILCKLALLFSLMAGLEKPSHKNHHEKRSRYAGPAEIFFLLFGTLVMPFWSGTKLLIRSSLGEGEKQRK